jgi:hypothetical protein
MMIVDFKVLENNVIDDFKAMVQLRSGNKITISYVQPKKPIEITSSGRFSYTETGDDPLANDFTIKGNFNSPTTATVSYSVKKFEGKALDWERKDIAIECEKPGS